MPALLTSAVEACWRERVDVGRVGDVELDRRDARAERLARGVRTPASTCAPQLREQERRRAADAGRGAGDQHGAAVEHRARAY